jgi:hypothetical protein
LCRRPSVAGLVEDLSEIKAAAEIQVSSISALVKELQAGMDRLVCELSLCRGSSQKEEGEGEDAFVAVVSRFVKDNQDECSSLTCCEIECTQQLRELNDYFDEKFDSSQPNRVLVTLRDFLASLSRAFRDHKRAKLKGIKR